MKTTIFITFICLSVFSNAQGLKVASHVKTTVSTGLPLSNNDNIAGLKNSLHIGIEQAVGKLGVENGFFNDAVLKLLLPPEAKPIIDNITLIPGGRDLVNKTVLSLNRSAEDAVKEATPIFKNAIMNMSFTDAKDILFGANNAATEYLRKSTYSELKIAFTPKVSVSLNKPLVGNLSTNESWKKLCSGYNSVAKTFAGRIAKLKPINVDLENYVTEKTLNALFMKVAEEEKTIRTNPVARVNDLLKKVFGQLDK